MLQLIGSDQGRNAVFDIQGPAKIDVRLVVEGERTGVGFHDAFGDREVALMRVK